MIINSNISALWIEYRMKFIFADLHGFGTYNQIYSSEKNEFVDCRVYLSSGN